MNKSYANFIESKSPNIIGSNILELGVGSGLNFLDFSSAMTLYEGVDIDEPSISNQLSKVYAQNSKFSSFDILSKDFQRPNQFDLIIDSHLLHCLEYKSQHEAYLKKIKSCLNMANEHARVFLEVMVETKVFENNYREFMIDRLFFCEGQTRYLFKTRQLEDLFVSQGFKIKYFCIESQFQFFLNDTFERGIDLVRVELEPIF